ncbi:oligopeptidase B ['Osedax' symbiont bacterium Rs2_46_30_T18]|nr:oligopeptidase B ['Osedax' symbiont bacterium Rs2_46_30_T18]
MSHLAQTPVAKAPVAKKISHEMQNHQHQRVDNYYWMRDDSRSDKQILAHLEAENDYAHAVLKPQEQLQQTIFDELKARIVKDDNSIPARDGKYWYHTQISGEQEFASFYRASSFAGADKTLLLDVNLRAEQHEYYDLGELSISPNDIVLSFSEDTDSRRIYSIYFKDIASAELLPDVLHDTEGDLVWSNDNQYVFYVKKDLQTLLGTEVYRHKMGTEQADDELVYQQQDHSFYMSLGKSRDDSVLFICLDATDSSDTLILDANHPLHQFEPLVAYTAMHEYQVDKLGDYYYIVTNWQAQNFRLMRAATADVADQSKWCEILPNSDTVLLEGVELFNHYYVLTLRENGQIRFVVQDINEAANSYTLNFDDVCYFSSLGDNPDPDSQSVRIYYSSLTTPGSWYQFNLASGERSLLKQQQVPGDFEAKNYASERIFVTARDAAEVPVSIVYRKDMFQRDGTNPLLQYAYGAYGITIDPSFSSGILSLLDRGFVFAIAHVRGSEMLGRHWYEQGKKEFKQNTFNDFVDVTKALVERGYGAGDKILARGGSAGGLLMGAICNQAPQLYLGIGSHVPFVDVLTTMLDESIPLTTNEYDEWGNPNNPEDYQVILKYSPYDNISAQNYPHILVTTGLHDSQVQYFEPMKWVAKLRELKTDSNLLLFKTDMDAGHGGAAGRFKSLHEKAIEMAFFISLVEEQGD